MAKLLLVVASMRGAGALAQHHEGAAGRAAPALLRRADQHVDAGGLHVDPHRAGGDAVEHEQAADLVHRIGHGLQVVVGQHHAGRGFDVRREHHRRLLARGWWPRPRRSAPARRASAGRRRRARLQHGARRRDAAHVEDLRPAVAEPAVADHQHRAAGGELARHRFHAEGAAAGHDDRRARVVDLLQHAGDVAHHALELARHVVERAVGVDHRVFEQAVGVDVGQQSGHEGLRAQGRFSLLGRKA